MGKYLGRNYGQANPGPTGPTGRVVVNPGQTSEAGAQRGSTPIVDTGSGPVVTSVSASPGRNEITVSRGDPSSGMVVPSPRFGAVSHDIPHIANPTSIPTIVKWAEFDSEGEIIPANTILLPYTFVHADGFGGDKPWVSNLPSGLGWARVGVGSEPLGEARWDADVIDDYVEPPEGADVRKKPSLVRAYLTDDVVTLVFNIPVFPPTRLYAQQLERFQVKSNKSGKVNITGIASGSAGNLVDLTLDSSPVEDERLSVRVSPSAVRSRKIPSWAAAGSFTGSSNKPSAVVPVIPRIQRSCYVLVMNRAIGGGNLTSGSKVILGACTTIRDTTGIEWPVYDAIPLAEGGSSSVAYLPATIASRYLAAPESHFYTPEILANDALWENTDLPITFQHGDVLPSTDLPPQVGWARLRYPAEEVISGRTGKAGEETEYGSTADPTEVTSLVRAELKGGTTLTLWFDYRTRMRAGLTGTQLNERLTVTNTAGVTPPTVVSVTETDKVNKFEVELTGVTPAQWQTIADGGGFFVNLLEVGTSLDPTLFYSADVTDTFIDNNTELEFPGVFNDDRSAYVLVLNRVMDHSIPPATAVNIAKDSYIDLPDSSDPVEYRRVYDISPGCVPAMLVCPGEVTKGIKLIGVDNDLEGIRYSAAEIVEVSEAWDPATSTLLQEGIGVVKLWRPDEEEVLVIHDVARAVQPCDLPVNTAVAVKLGQAVSIPVAATDPVEYVVAYPMRLL